MIFEAVDTAITLLNALAVWILIGAALLTVALFTLLAVLWLLWRLAVRAVAGPWRALTGRPGGVQALEVPTEVGPTPEGVSARTAAPAPTWAHTEQREDQAA